MTKVEPGPLLSAGIDDDPNWPKLDNAALHGIVGEIVATATENSEADPAAVLATLITHAGIVVGRAPQLRVADSFHHARLFCAIVGRSARARKGTSEAPVKRIWEAAVKHGCAPLSWRPGPMSSGEGLIAAIRDGRDADDPGVEDKRLLIVEGELAAPLRAMQRQGNMLSTFIRTAWDGGTIEPLTKGDPIKVTAPHIGIVGHITLEELHALLGSVELSNGFANRFLWFLARRAKSIPLASGMTNAQVDGLGRSYGELLQHASRLAELEFTDDARHAYSQWYHGLTDRLGKWGDATSRAEAQVARLALTYAVLDASPLITTQHVGAALAVWNYCDQSARYIFAGVRVDPVERRVCEALAFGQKTTTELHADFGRHIEGQQLTNALRKLETAGRVRKNKINTGGRPVTAWELVREDEPAKEAKYAN